MRKLLVLLLAGCADSAPSFPVPTDEAALHVLFVGNSLTYTNDLPGMLRALGESTGVRVDAQALADPDYALEDHWADGRALQAIANGGWDIVVLQQGPSALQASRVNLLQWVDSFAVRIRAAGAEPALYQVWPASQNIGRDLLRSLQSYEMAAAQVNGLLLPAGRAWSLAWSHSPTLALYGYDGFHPSELGTYVAAVTIFAALTGRSPVGLPSTLSRGGTTVTVGAAVAAMVQQAAADALTLPAAAR